ncbi:MAG: pantetheine-phosphate adenylyltransferase [Bacteroidaceae bacterium]|nr:pantetheine-phosphate adenylyltransferase [Bacteroidaceae bacterium]
MKLLFPGSFDPFTIGHLDLVQRALKIADGVVIAVGINESKKCMFTAQERVDAIARFFESEPRVSVLSYSGLTMDMVRKTGADAILRGVRSVSDFEFERNMADVNGKVGGVETIMLASAPQLQHVSSSVVRELALFGHDVSDMIIDTFDLKR